VQKWHEAGNTVFRGKEKTALHLELGKDEKMENDCGKVQNATVA
jgi:hypothetical protein